MLAKQLMKAMGALAFCTMAAGQSAPAPTTSLAATSPTAETRPRQDLAISEADQGKVIHLGDSPMVTIVLTGNVTTGYSWSVSKIEGEALTQTGEIQYSPTKNAVNVVGSGGTSSVMFRPVKIGEAKVTLVYKRPWEKDVVPAKMFEVTLVVDKMPEGAAAASEPATAPVTTHKEKP
ncbi:MAG TPA: protease inhibitor I42 family protein [Phycisphaerae bacterium]